MIADVRQRFAELKAGGGLPSPQGVALAIARLATRDDVGTEALTRLVKSDPAMAGRLLRSANAAHAGSRRHIASLTQAVVFLGLYRIRQLALAFSLVDSYRQGRCSAFDYEAYWARSLATAVGAQELAHFAQVPREESFTCGLLAGIGRLGLATVFPAEYAELLTSVAQAGGSPATLAQAEAAAFAIDHAQLSGEMLADWGLPTIFADAVRHHEAPEESPFPTGSRVDNLARVLHLAAGIARALSSAPPQLPSQDPQLLYNAAARIGLEAAELAPTIERIANGWGEWGSELRLPTQHPPVSDLLVVVPPSEMPPRQALVLTPLRIVSISDDPQLLAGLADCLRHLEQTALAAGAWTHVARTVSETQPEILLVDARVAPDAGQALIRAIRKAEAPHHGFLLALVRGDAESGVADLIRAGADDYLCWPPIDAAVFEARLHAAQRVVALQSAVRSEREAAIRHSSEWARSNRRLLHDALTDPLTELPNRRYGMDHLNQECAFAGEMKMPLACIMLDIDHFKKVNDHYGHEVGDQVLQQVAATIQSNSRRNDIVFRFGGEEFCIVCPVTGADEAAGLAERILAAVRALSFAAAAGRFHVTISAGVATRRAGTESPEKLLAAADSALYRAKVGGRDRVAGASTG